MTMPRVAAGDKSDSKSEGRPPPYSPSWVDHFTAWVDRLPGPSWLYYVGLGLVLLLVQIILLWIEGAYPVGTFFPAQAYTAGAVAYVLALLPYLDNRADSALTTLRPALKVSEEEYSQLRYQLTTLPARPTVLASLVAVTFIVLTEQLWGSPTGYEALASSPVSATLSYSVYLISWWPFSAFVYHTVHHLRLINRIYCRHTCIDLFRMRPLYAFSNLTAVTAASLAFLTYGWQAINPGMLFDPTAFGIALLIAVLAASTFVWPLLGIHRLLVEEKERLLDNSSLRLEAALVELDQRMDSGDLEGMEDLNMAIASLEIEQNVLSRIPTWPWQPETVRLLLAALLFPLGLWITQIVLQGILGP